MSRNPQQSKSSKPGEGLSHLGRRVQGRRRAQAPLPVDQTVLGHYDKKTRARVLLPKEEA